MFCKATLITTALALMASATPVVTPKRGVSIPFQKRSALTNADGTFNADQAKIESVKTAKYAISVISTRTTRTDATPSFSLANTVRT